MRMLQSSYRQHHSTETALLRVQNDVLMNMDKQKVTLLVLLDLSAVFDTVDHGMVANILENDFGLLTKLFAGLHPFWLLENSVSSSTRNSSGILISPVESLKGAALVPYSSQCVLLGYFALLRDIYHLCRATLMILSCTCDFVLVPVRRRMRQ